MSKSGPTSPAWPTAKAKPGTQTIDNSIVWEKQGNVKPTCFNHPDCPMTMGYYIGGGMYICWLHALYLPCFPFSGQELVGMVRSDV